MINKDNTVVNEIKARNCLMEQLHFHELQHAFIYWFVYLGQDLPPLDQIGHQLTPISLPRCLTLHAEACVRPTQVCTLLPYIIQTESQFTEQVQILNVFEQPFPPLEIRQN